MTAPETARPRALTLVTAALSTAAVLYFALAVLRMVLYPSFASDSSDGCWGVLAFIDQDPSYATACEQFAPLAWHGPYWLAALDFMLFAAVFAVAAALTGGARPSAARFTLLTAVLAAVLCALPSLFDLGWRFAIATSDTADAWVAEYVRSRVPLWSTITENTALIAALALSVFATWSLRRSPLGSAAGRQRSGTRGGRG